MTRLYLVAAALILGCVMIFFVPIFALVILAMGIWIILTGNITINGDDNNEQHRMGTK